jgi:hypothetical protein
MSEDKNIQEPMKTLMEIHKGKSEMLEAFVRASKNFRQPTFDKKVDYTTNSGKRTKFEYASLGELLDCVRKPLLNEGFVICFDNYADDDCKQWLDCYLLYKTGLKHGHQKRRIVTDGKTAQEISGQETYFKRYSIAGIASLSAESDNDAKEVEGDILQDSKKDFIAPSQIRELEKLLFDLPETELEATLKFAKAKELNQITQDKFNTIFNTLKAKAKLLKTKSEVK